MQLGLWVYGFDMRQWEKHRINERLKDQRSNEITSVYDAEISLRNAQRISALKANLVHIRLVIYLPEPFSLQDAILRPLSSPLSDS